MKQFKFKCLTVILLSLIMTIGMFSGTAAAATGSELPDSSELMAENNKAALYFDPETAQVSILYKNSGLVVDTKILEGTSGNGTYKEYQKSDVIINYYAEEDSKNTTMVNNYSKAIASGQFETEKIENGFRVVYTLKDDKLSIDCVPKYISDERMQSLVLDYISKDERDWFKQFYRSFEGKYSRTKDPDDGVIQSNIAELYRLFYEVGTYTEEDLEYDNAENGYESTWTNLEIQIVFEYVLEGSDLVVRIPMDEFSTNSEDFILNSMTVLPYILSSTTEENGYIVVPDGSGAVINFNNGLIKSNNYVSRVYGEDILIDADEYDTTEYYATMPIIGMVYEDYAYLAIVEKGDAMAEINAQISGKYDGYNSANFKFYITDMENVASSTSAAVTFNKFTGDTYQDDIVIRYRILQDEEDINYTGIAREYQQYLINRGVLSKEKREANASLDLKVLGAAKEAQTFLGVPHEGMTALTTFSQLGEMIQYFQLQGVDDIAVELTGWANKGENNTALTGISHESVLGSKNDMKRLMDYIKESNYSFYPGLNFQTVSAADNVWSGLSTSSFARSNASRFLSSEYAQIYESQLGLDHLMKRSDSPYLVSPNKLLSYTSKALSKLESYGLSGICVQDIGSLLVPDYNSKKSVSRESAMAIERQALSAIGEKYSVMLSNPYAYSWEYADKLVDLPIRSNQYNIFDYDVPLLQLVLDGCISYSTEALNLNTQQSDSQMILKCVESRTNPRYMLMYADMKALETTNDYFDLLSVNYNTWKERIVSLYNEYNEFYQKVKDADIKLHETISRNVSKVTYTNGVVVYVNNTSKARTVDGISVPAFSYKVVQ